MMQDAMARGLLTLSIALLWAASSPAAVQPAPNQFIIADVVNVRDSPRVGAPVLAKLRINTQVELLNQNQQEGFYRIRLTLLAGSVEGYVSKDALGPERVSFDAALNRAKELSSSAQYRLEARKWAERAVALDGTSEEALQILVGLLDDKASVTARGHVRDILGGRASAWIALCRASSNQKAVRPTPTKSVSRT
jgi:hypothetical protein